MDSLKIGVIGGTGFIGRHLLERLAVAHAPVRVLVHREPPLWLLRLPGIQPVSGNLLDAATLPPFLTGLDTVINLAGQVSAEVAEYQRLNLGAMISLAKACSVFDVNRIIHASSALVYGDVLGAKETDHARPMTPYATMKLAAEEILGGLLAPGRFLSLRLSNVYGPFQKKGLMPYLITRIRERQRITIDADGAQVRDFVHVADVVQAFVQALETPGCYGILNIGSGQATSIMQLVRMLENALETPATGQYCPEHTGGERRNTLNVEKALTVLGWRADVALPEGVKAVGSRLSERSGEEVYAS